MIGIGETWLTSEIPNSVVQIQGYQTYRSLPEGRGKGCLLYVKEKFRARQLDKYSDGEFKILDTIWCEIPLKQRDSLIVGVCYRSPNCPENYNDKLNSQIKKVCDDGPSHMCIMGDFNFKEVKWDLHIVEGSSNSQARKFYENMQDLFTTRFSIYK